MLNLDPIKQRLAAATPGPWGALGPGASGLCYVSGPGITQVGQADAALIANAPTDIAALVAEVQRLDGLMAEFTSIIQRQNAERNDLVARADRAEAQLATLTKERDAEILRARKAEAEVERLKHPYRIAKCDCFLPTCLMCSEQDQ